jgi:hypothetical protein
MKRTSLFLASCALLALPMTPAGAGQCGIDVTSFTKMLAAHDAGSGPTAGAPGSSMGQHPPTSAMSQADKGGAASSTAAQTDKPQHPPTAMMNRETTGSAPSSSASPPSREPHPPTDVMNRETQGSAASPQDVQRQTAGQPTAAQQAQGRLPTIGDRASALAELDRARSFDEQGKDAECVTALGRAKLMLGMH